MESCTDHKRNYMVPEIIKLQYQMIGRINCTLHVRLDFISKNFRFPFALTCKLV